MKHAILLSAVPVDAAMKRYCRPGSFVVACDAGYRNSDCLPHVKDDTDTHYAAKWLLENGYTQVTMLGALGGARLEHTIANLSTGLFLAEHGVDVVLADTASEIHYLVPGKDLTLQRGEWQYLSVFPWDGKLIGVDIEGAYYPLHGAELVPDFPLGVSNEFVEPTVTLRCQAGHGIVVLTRAD